MKKLAPLALLFALGAMLLNPPDGDACGPFLPEAQFAFIHQPTLGAFFAGRLGIVKPEYYRKYLVAAYRYFDGVPLTKAEIDGPAAPPARSGNAPDRWLAARNAVPGVNPIPSIDAFRFFQRGADYINFQNCLDDSFDSAASALAARSKQWGASAPATLDWLAGQDAVFANCGENPPLQLPAPAPASANPLLKADRQYQHAAALFYAMHYDEADSAFRDIGQPYLAARALLRKATVAGAASLPQAETALRAVLADPAQRRFHDSARGLLLFIAGRLHPMDRMTALAAALSKPDPKFDDDLTDFTALWDRSNAGPVQTSELADWITTFQARQSQHAVERWRATKSKTWLMAALASAGPKDSAVSDLVAAARAIAKNDPAYPTAVAYAIRLVPPDQARAWATEALPQAEPELANALHAERLKLARNFTEFLTDAPRVPVAETTDLEDEDVEDTKPLFDTDAATVFNAKTPLSQWIEAAGSPLLPPRLQTLVAQTAWVRAVLLNKLNDAAPLAKRAGLQPAGPSHFDAIDFMLHNPGVTPLLRAGYLRREPVAELDELRDNWWDLKPADAGEIPSTMLNGPDYLCAETLAWAKAHPEDPRVPEALHLAVRTTRYGQTDKETTNYSKACFQLLHSKYPTSKWAALTKYWY